MFGFFDRTRCGKNLQPVLTIHITTVTDPDNKHHETIIFDTAYHDVIREEPVIHIDE